MMDVPTLHQSKLHEAFASLSESDLRRVRIVLASRIFDLDMRSSKDSLSLRTQTLAEAKQSRLDLDHRNYLADIYNRIS